MPAVSGRIYTPEGFLGGTLDLDGGLIQRVSTQVGTDVLAKGLVIPSFFNAHTHLGDSIILEEPTGTLEEIVKPPDGLKFRRLEKVSRKDMIERIQECLERMVLSGTAGFCDFREGGREGVGALMEALRDSPLQGVILGRPAGMAYDKGEMDALLPLVSGIGLSGVSDWDYGEMEKVARHTRSAGKLFALHASEAHREDIDQVLDLKPDLLVHMTAGSEDDWMRCAQEGVPVAVCPRSQLHFGRAPNIPRMLAAGLTLMLGTDNAMFSSPSMLREIEFAYRLAKLEGGTPPQTVLAMAYAGAKLLRKRPPSPLQEGTPSDILVLDVPLGGDEAYQVIKATEGDIILISLGERIWLRGRGWLERT